MMAAAPDEAERPKDTDGDGAPSPTPSPCALSLTLSQSVYFPGSTVQCRVEVRCRRRHHGASST
jgi:hypothetical protein